MELNGILVAPKREEIYKIHTMKINKNNVSGLIIISDILGNSKSIITYGLRLAKFLRLDVEIVHTIDSRTQQAVQSPYADSQTISPGSKLSHQEIIQREKNKASTALQNLLSQEASRLNYPLKIKTRIVENSIENELAERTEKLGQVIFLASSRPDGYVFHSRQEIVQCFSNLNALSLQVAPDSKFEAFKKVLLITDFNDTNLNQLECAGDFLHAFDPFIEVVDVAKENYKNELEKKSQVWFEKFQEVQGGNKISATVLTGTNYIHAIDACVTTTRPDLILHFKNGRGVFDLNFHEKLYGNLLKDFSQPILHC